MLQSQLQLKKATNVSSVKKDGQTSSSTPATTQRAKPSLAPVKDFKKGKKENNSNDESKLSYTPTVSKYRVFRNSENI